MFLMFHHFKCQKSSQSKITENERYNRYSIVKIITKSKYNFIVNYS